MQSRRRPIAVLLVDDQRFIGLALEQLLAGESDIELHCCEKAPDAIARANAIKPTVILQDLVMPDIDGLTLIGLFRRNAATAGTPIIVMSGDDDATARAQSLAAGANDYFVKLPAKATLVDCLRKHAGQPRTTLTAAADDSPRRGDHGVDQDTLDYDVIAAFRDPVGGGLGGFAGRLFDQFMQEAESRVATLRDAIGGRNDELLRSTAHSLKGSALTVGATRLGGLCSRLEDGLNGHPGESAAPLMTAIDEELSRVREALGGL